MPELIIAPKAVPAKSQPKYRLARKILVWTVVLAVGPTLLYAVWANRLIHQSFQHNHRQNVEMLGQAIAAACVAQPNMSLSESAGRVLDVVELDRRLAFVAVADSENNILHRRTADPDAWAAHESWLNKYRAETVSTNHTITLGNHGDLAVYKVPIFSTPSYGIEPTRKNIQSRTVVGYVVLALRETTLIQTLNQLQAAQVAAIAALGLLVAAMMAWLVRKWTAPLMHLLKATEDIANGAPPSPLAVHARDELGMLTDAFNRMARRLYAVRHQLQLANNQLQTNNVDLEHQVEQRTVQLREVNRKLANAVEQLQTMATTDPLTELANRRAFNEAMQRTFYEAQRREEDLACLVIDLDGFKQLNDTLGHHLGDEMLKRCGKALRSVCRRSDVAGRFGGDEFVLLLPGATEVIADGIANRIRDTFAREVSEVLDKHPTAPIVTMSMGLACLSDTQATSPEDLFNRADNALYKAKREGKARLVHAA